MRKPSTKIAHSQSENAVLNPAGKVLRAVGKARWKWTLKGTLSFHAVAFSDSLEASDSNSRPSARATARAKPLLTPCSSPELSAGAAALSCQQGPGTATSSTCGALAVTGKQPHTRSPGAPCLTRNTHPA